MNGSAQSWHAVGPALAQRGYRAIAVDLPGHGQSLRDPEATIDSVVAAVAASVTAPPALALGHSLGGMVLVAALPALSPARAVYIEAPIGSRWPAGPVDLAGLAARYATDKAARTAAALRARSPHWSAEDVAAEADAAQRWDVATAVAIAASARGRDFAPPAASGRVSVPSLVVHAEPSDHLSGADLANLTETGCTVRGIPGAGHSVWYGNLHTFLGVLDRWISHPPTPC
jgi:pimeloyl-ACP methyl ester carboxylesterase